MQALQLAFLYLAPWLALMLILLAGRYPGEEAIARIASRRAGRTRRAKTARSEPPRTRRPDLTCSGGLLLARRLAGRGPP